MAELPRYQPTGRVFADVPQLDFANVRESFKSAQSMTNALDKLSNFAYKQAALNVEKEAEQFSVQNPITLEQLQEAEKSGVTAADLVKASGGGAIWQNTVKKFQAAQLRTQLEVEAQSAGMQILNDVKANKISGNEVGAKFDSLVNGMGKPLAGLDAEEYTKFKSSVGGVVKSLHKAALDKAYDDYKLEAEIKTNNYMTVAGDAFDVVLKTEKNPELIDAQKRLMTQTLISISKESGKPEVVLRTINGINKIFEDKTINHLVVMASDPQFAKNAGEALTKLANNNLKVSNENDYSALYKNQTPENQAKVRSFIRQKFIDINTTNNEIEKNTVEEQKAKANELEMEYYKTKNPKLLEDLKAISIASRGKAINANKIESIKKSGEEKDSDVQYTDNVILMKDENRKGRYDSIEQVYARGEVLGVSRKTINKYVMPSFLNKSDALADSILDDYADISNPSGSRASKVRKRIAIGQEVDALFDAQANQDPLKRKSKAEIAGELVDKKLKGSSANQSKVTTLNELGKRYKLPQFTAASTLDEDVEQDIDRKVSDLTDRAEIKRQLKALSGK